MPLLSRFRRTVNSVKPKANHNSSASNSNGKSSTIVPHSYQRSTKSSTDKSLKPTSSFRGYLNLDSSGKDSTRNGRINGNGTPKSIEIDYARDGPLLRRSSTFTLDNDDEIENVPDEPQRYRHSHDQQHGGGDVSGTDEYHHRNSGLNSYGRSRGKPVYGLYYIHKIRSHHIHTRCM